MYCITALTITIVFLAASPQRQTVTADEAIAAADEQTPKEIQPGADQMNKLPDEGLSLAAYPGGTATNDSKLPKLLTILARPNNTTTTTAEQQKTTSEKERATTPVQVAPVANETASAAAADDDARFFHLMNHVATGFKHCTGSSSSQHSTAGSSSHHHPAANATAAAAAAANATAALIPEAIRAQVYALNTLVRIGCGLVCPKVPVVDPRETMIRFFTLHPMEMKHAGCCGESVVTGGASGAEPDASSASSSDDCFNAATTPEAQFGHELGVDDASWAALVAAVRAEGVEHGIRVKPDEALLQAAVSDLLRANPRLERRFGDVMKAVDAEHCAPSSSDKTTTTQNAVVFEDNQRFVKTAS